MMLPRLFCDIPGISRPQLLEGEPCMYHFLDGLEETWKAVYVSGGTTTIISDFGSMNSKQTCCQGVHGVFVYHGRDFGGSRE